MIARLILRKFGKFSDKTLKFSPFTVITGPNEAGKTTVFDALFDNLCEGGKNDLVFRRLKERYGKDRKSVVEWARGSEQPKYDAYEFLDIFAIRAGQLHIDASGDGAWFRAFKNALFTGGVDPAELAGELSEAGRDARNKPLVKKLAALEAEIAGLKEDADAERNRREAVLAGEGTLKRLAAVLEEVRERTAAKEKELAGVLREYEAARDGVELAHIRGLLASLRELEELEVRAKALEAYSEGGLGTYDMLTAAHEQKKEELALKRGALAEKEKAAEAAKTALDAARAVEPVLRRRAELAAAFRTEIERFLAEAARTLHTTVNQPLRLGVWGAGLALALGFSFWLKGGAGVVVASVMALLSGAVGWFASQKTTLGWIDPQESADLLARLADGWRNAGFDAAQVRRETPGGMRDAFSAVLADCGAGREALEKSALAAAQAERERKELSQKAALAEAGRREAEESARKWLAEKGCKDRDEYKAKADTRARLEADIRARTGAALDMAKAYSCRGLRDFKSGLLDRAAQLERGGARGNATAEEAKELERNCGDLREEARILKESLLREGAELQKHREVAATRLEGVPESIAYLSADIDAKEAEAAGIRVMLAGYRLAAAAFERIAAGSGIKLKALTEEVGGMIERALPGRAVEFTAFELGGAAMTDAGGRMSSVDALSSGTRDLFMLGARLALARRTRLGPDGLSPALLVLDEPFYTLDQDRTWSALRLLGAFHAETKWQIVILTKDPAAASLARSMEFPVTEIKLGIK